MSDVSGQPPSEVLGRDLFLDLLDRLPQAVLILAEDGRIRFWSSGAEALLGHRAPDMIGRESEGLLPPEKLLSGESARLLAHAKAGGEMRDLETERLARDGRRISVLVTQSPIRGPGGEFLGMIQSLTDISEQKSLLRNLERRVHQLSIVKEIGEALHGTMDLEEILHLILVGATAGPGLRFNRAFLLFTDEEGKRLVGRLAIGPGNREEAGRIWGQLSQKPTTLRQMMKRYERSLAETDTIINQLVRELVLPLDDVSSLLARAVRSGEALVATEGAFSDADRELARRLGTSAFAVAPLRARDRKIGALLADNAITEREIQADDVEMLQLLATTASLAIDNSRLYAELARRLASLEAARAEARHHQQALLRAERLSAIGEMATTVAHEIRNPLVAIGGFARSLLRSHDPSDPRYEHFSIMIEEVRRLEGIVTKVLDYARPVSADIKSVQANGILQEAANLLSQEFEDNAIEVSLRLDPGLPVVGADSDRLFEMALNLLRNAMQAMPGGGQVSIMSKSAGEFVELRFNDNGHGIPEEVRDRIFSPFFTTRPAGSGLGLTIVSQIVREHGGEIDVQSDVGVGTTFTVRLPLRGGEAHDDESARR